MKQLEVKAQHIQAMLDSGRLLHMKEGHSYHKIMKVTPGYGPWGFVYAVLLDMEGRRFEHVFPRGGKVICWEQ